MSLPQDNDAVLTEPQPDRQVPLHVACNQTIQQWNNLKTQEHDNRMSRDKILEYIVANPGKDRTVARHVIDLLAVIDDRFKPFQRNEKEEYINGSQ